MPCGVPLPKGVSGSGREVLVTFQASLCQRVEIGEWTKDHFGDDKAGAYLEHLIAQC